MIKKAALFIIIFMFFSKIIYAVTPSSMLAISDNAPTEFTLEKLLLLSPKKFEKATGTHLSFKQKIAYRLLQWKMRYELNHPTKTEADIAKAQKHSKAALFCGIATWGVLLLGLFLPVIGILSFPFSIAAIIYGSISINKTSNNTNSILGIVLGSVFLVLFAVVLLLVFSLINQR